MSLIKKLSRFAGKPLPDKWAAIRVAVEEIRLYRLLTGTHAPPRVFATPKKTYIAYRPDSDVQHQNYPELSELSGKWIKDNLMNNSGDLPRLYALVMNIRQVLEDRIAGDMAELGVYKGNSAAILAYYAGMHNRDVFLFDTFEGFDPHDRAGFDAAQMSGFDDTSLSRVQNFLKNENITFVQGRFPNSIPSDLYDMRLCIAHIDCDLYDPAKAGLEFFYPRLSPGGLIIVHDYANPSWSGIKRAVDEYCLAIPEKPLVFGDKSGTAMIRKSTPRSIA